MFTSYDSVRFVRFYANGYGEPMFRSLNTFLHHLSSLIDIITHVMFSFEFVSISNQPDQVSEFYELVIKQLAAPSMDNRKDNFGCLDFECGLIIQRS